MTHKTCTEQDCDRETYAKGLCARHYQRARSAGTLPSSLVTEKPCAHCGQPMAGRKTTRAKFCSPVCKEDARSELAKLARRVQNLDRTCEWCGGPMRDDAPASALTCSPKCGYSRSNHISGGAAKRREARRAAWDANRPDCIGCGVRIPDGRRVGVKFCSADCKKKAHDARWRANAPGYNRKYLYGMTDEQFAAMLDKQGGACAICHATEWNGRHPVPHVDHDHATGKVRGILCHSCNLGLGKFKDDPDLLRAAIAYLTR
jgi:hypothetical protein